MRVDLQAAREARLGRLDALVVVEHAAPAERVDDERGAQIAAVGVDDVARPPVDLRGLEPGVAAVEQELAQAPVVEGGERERQLPAERPVARVHDKVAERLLDRRREPQMLEPLGRSGAGGGLTLPDLVAIDHEDAAVTGELAGHRETGEAGAADDDVRVGVERGPLNASLGGPDRHGQRRIERTARR